ncbi:Wzz/FepE/Etk N-terminal domain-containing protein [Pseudoalteromonas sp. SR41-1]|uniref:Wzz/FepE/Etk N-terminal domain-containing protein n=1 Tax=Pseudoalteromonas sp. SR41-1 TaxID=2760952 RepID=UPI0015FFF6E8|nr:Wzz/FepE/Etk N-terminal domain-containing protein [Pseudoalteromonas sp. SR41-1]MBB1279872.1 LPS O-antigen length regulator [Pseudoalteromonas sp. SR41-1]
MKKNETSNIPDDEIDLTTLLSVIWKGKWAVIFSTVVLCTFSVIYAVNQPNIYKSEALLSPAEEQKSGGLGALAGQFGGLASLAGVNLGSDSNNKTQLAIEVLKSRQFISNFIQKHKLLPNLMAAEYWNAQDNKIRYDPELYDVAAHQWVREVSSPYKSKPSLQEAYKEFRKVTSISTDKETGMIILSVESISPYVAQQWVSWLIEDINQEMKYRDVSEANKSTAFLTKQLKETKVADIRSVLYKLVEEQAKTIMFANVRDEYVFKTIDPALVPEEKSGPKRALICILGTFFGGILGILFVTIRYFTKENAQ